MLTTPFRAKTIPTLRKHWTKISTGLLIAAALGVGGAKLYQHFAGDCCEPGSSCCHPGSPCCAHGAQGVAQK